MNPPKPPSRSHEASASRMVCHWSGTGRGGGATTAAILTGSGGGATASGGSPLVVANVERLAITVRFTTGAADGLDVTGACAAISAGALTLVLAGAGSGSGVTADWWSCDATA